jgi:hypothetical protein
MAGQFKGPRLEKLTKNETSDSYKTWKSNLLFQLSTVDQYATFLVEGATWQKKSAAYPSRGYTDDGVDVVVRLTAVQKCARLEMMLGFIAGYCPVIARNTIVLNSTSLPYVWNKIREHYQFQSSGAYFLDLSSYKLENGERYEDLFQRLSSFFDDNLMSVESGIHHHGDAIVADEDVTPTIENFIVYYWLLLINPALPLFVKQRFGSELRNKSLASLKPEISQSLKTLIDELKSFDDAKVLRASTFNTANFKPRRPSPRTPQAKSCALCKASSRKHDHFMSTCSFLTEADRNAISRSVARTRLVGDAEEDYDEDCPDDYGELEHDPLLDKPASVRRVDVIQSPYLNAYYKSQPVKITLDTGATSNMVHTSCAKKLNLHVDTITLFKRRSRLMVSLPWKYLVKFSLKSRGVGVRLMYQRW